MGVLCELYKCHYPFRVPKVLGTPCDKRPSLSHLTYTECVMPEKIHTHPMEGDWKFLGGGGGVLAKLFEATYENKLEFPGGTGRGSAKPSMRGVWIFSRTAQ